MSQRTFKAPYPTKHPARELGLTRVCGGWAQAGILRKIERCVDLESRG